MLAVIAVCMAAAIGLISLWISIGPDHFMFPVVTAALSLGLPPIAGTGLARKVPRTMFRVSPRTVRLFRWLGVGVFDRLLSAVGWNSWIVKDRTSLRSPGDATGLAGDMRRSAAGHGLGLLIHLVPGIVALGGGHVLATAWILLPAVPLHLCPLMLQLVNLRRLDVVLRRARVTR